jgi:hypothetical protein
MLKAKAAQLLAFFLFQHNNEFDGILLPFSVSQSKCLNELILDQAQNLWSKAIKHIN